jgi:hypothetical protein
MLSLLRSARLITLITFAIIFAFIFTTLAVATPSPNSNSQGKAKTATDSAKGKGKGRDKLENRLTEVKLKVCEKKEASIKKRSTKLVDKAANIQTRFDRIKEKVDVYYVEVVAPKAGEIENYSDLLQNIEDHRRAAAHYVGVAGSTAENYTCEGENPKEQIKQFKADMKRVIISLQGYKKAVVNLIVAVRTKGKNIKESQPVATDSAKPSTESADTE